MPDYYFSGLHIASEFALPGIPAWTGHGEPDVTIATGHVPDRLPGAHGNLFQVSGDSLVRVQFPRVGTFLLDSGQRVTVAAKPDAAPTDIALFLLGSVFGLLCHQRGLLPLHASAVDIGGRAIAFTGDSGAGKSTTAAALVRRGHALLSDDISVLDSSGDTLMLVSTSPKQKLWGDSLRALGLEAGARVRPQLDIDKFEHNASSAFDAAPRPLAAICHLQTASDDGRPMLEPIAGARALQGVRHNIYRLQAAQEMGKEQRLFLQSATIAATIPQFILRRPATLDGLESFAEAIADFFTPATDDGVAAAAPTAQHG
ncbi:HPr kinase [Sphingomonas sp. HMWF008]|nr:HPr kinase [Sphingomonas sp. HMWF008]